MSIKSIALAVSTVVLSSTVNAAIISVDWKNANDNLITQDTTSGLYWLDLTATRNRSYNDISSQFGVGGEFEGWRYANISEVAGYFDAFGGDNNYYNELSTQNNGLFDAIAPFWGDMYCGLITCPNGDGDGFSNFFMLEQGGLRMGQIFDRYDVSLYDLKDDVRIQGTPYNFSSPQIMTGSALVRTSAVPVPAAIWLFGSGLLGIFGIAKKRRRA